MRGLKQHASASSDACTVAAAVVNDAKILLISLHPSHSFQPSLTWHDPQTISKEQLRGMGVGEMKRPNPN